MFQPVEEIHFDESKETEEQFAARSWERHKKRNNSIVVDLFHGQYKSRVECPDCHKVSITFDPFCMVSLPVPSIKKLPLKLVLYLIDKDATIIPKKITLEDLNAKLTVEEILEQIGKSLKKERKNLKLYLFSENKPVEFIDNSKDMQYVNDSPQCAFIFELPGNEEASKGNIPEEKKASPAPEPKKPETPPISQPNPSPIQTEEKKEENTIAQPTPQTIQTEVKKENNKMVPENVKKPEPMQQEKNPDPAPAPSPLIFVKFHVYQEGGQFYNKDKSISYTRMIFLSGSTTANMLHLTAYEKFRSHILTYFKRSADSKNECLIKLEANDNETLTKEYEALFKGKPEDSRFYIINLVNLGYANKSPCINCDKSNCIACQYTEASPLTLQQISEKYKSKEIVFEIRFQKDLRMEYFSLNRCEEFLMDKITKEEEFKNITVYSCLDKFSEIEKLEKPNEWYCPNCKGFKGATKKMELYRAPNLLILHLKRFKNSRVSNYGFYSSYYGSKITSLIHFPLENLDLTPHVKGKPLDSLPLKYDLYAVSNHYGSTGGGHYTAYVKNPFKNIWIDCNDSSTHKATESEICSAEAYVLFYIKQNAFKPPLD